MLLLSPCPTADPAHALERWDWSQWRTASEPSGQGLSTPTAELPPDDETVLLVPDHLLSWHRVALPKVQAGRLRATLEGLLEEHLLDDLPQLHFTLAPEARPGRHATDTWVAVCRKDGLQTAVRALQDAGRHLNRIAPLATPRATTHLVAQETPHGPCLTVMSPQGVTRLALSDTPPSIGLIPQTGADGTVTAWADPASLAWAERLVPTSTWQPASPVQLARQLSDNGWNLAQGELTLAMAGRQGVRLRQGLRSLWQVPAWRPLRWGLATLLLVQLLGLNLLAWRERQALQQQHTQMRQLLTDSFPHVTLVLDAPLQMQRELERLRQAQGAVDKAGLEPLLQTLAQALPDAAVAPQTIGFTPQQTTLTGWPLSPQQQAAVEQAASSAGWRVQRQGHDWHLTPKTQP